MLERIKGTLWRNRSTGRIVLVEYMTYNKRVLFVRMSGTKGYMPLHDFVARYVLDPEALLQIFESGVLDT